MTSIEKQQKLLDLRAAGKTIRQAAAEVGIGYGTANRYCAAATAAESAKLSREQVLDLIREALGVQPAGGDGASLVSTIQAAAAPENAKAAARGVIDLGTGPRRPEQIAFLSDIHHPFHDKRALRIALDAIRDYAPDVIILGGDYFDCYSISDHSREPGRADSIQDEFDVAKPTTAEIDDLAKSLNARVIFMEGNHEARLSRIVERNPGLFRLRALEFPKVAELPEGWEFLPCQGRVKLGALSILHGDIKGRGTATMHAAASMLKKLRTSCLFGHLHRFQEFHETSDDGTVRGGFASGHLSDPSQAHYITSPDWQQGFRTIDFDWSRGIFSVLPRMIVNGSLRWGPKTYAA